MRRDDDRKRISLGLLLIVASVGAAVQAATLELESPQPNQKYQGRVTVRGNLRNSPNRLVKVRITGFDQIHRFLFEPLDSGATVDKRTFVDDYFLCKPGTHTVELTAYAVDQPDKPLVQQRVTFTIEKPDKIDFSRVYLGTRDQKLIEFERRFAVLAGFRSTDPAYQETLQKTADQLHKWRVVYAMDLLSNCSYYLAQAHAQVMDERRTLGCLQTAAQVYDRDLPGLVAHPLKGQIEWRHLADTVPYFFGNMANLYARHAQLDKAIEWLQKELEFCEGRRKGLTTPADRQAILRRTANVHRRIAEMYLLLADDMEAWRKWTDLAVTFDRQGRDMAAP
jgi:hypothetical protein